MTRSFVGAGTMALLMVSSIMAHAQDEPRFTARRDGHRTVVSVEAGDLTATQTLTRTGFTLHLTTPDDHVRFTGDVQGRISVQRGAGEHRFALREATPADHTILQALLTGSNAVEAFDALMRTTWAQTSKPAVVFAAAHGLVASVRGEPRPATRIAATVEGSTPELRRVRAGRPDDCWTAYVQDVVGYTVDLEVCLAESWNPLRTAWCAYEYNIKTSFAFVWLFDCYGIL